MQKEDKNTGSEVIRKYGDIIDLPRPELKYHIRMPAQDRAAQFSPFAALTGYEEAVTETGRLTESRKVLDEQKMQELDRKLQWVREHLSEQPTLEVTWFCPDEKKDGGAFYTETKTLQKINALSQALIFTDQTTVSLNDLVELQIVRNETEDAY